MVCRVHIPRHYSYRYVEIMTMQRSTRLSRRNLLIRSAMGLGSVSLRSLATGLPAGFLLGLKSGAWAAPSDAKFLIMSHKQPADPINTNAPGTYPDNAGNTDDPLSQIQHPRVSELGEVAAGYETPVTFNLGAQQVRAAKPWSTLAPELRNRLAFWNHGTYTNAHPDFSSVMAFNGAIKGPGGRGKDQLDGLIATETRAKLNTLFAEPISVGGSAIDFNNRVQPVLRPLDIKALFESQIVNIEQMIALRNHFIDDVYAEVKSTGSPAHKAFMDRYVLSQQEANQMGDNLGELITDIDGNDQNNQVKMAVALLQLNLTPVVTLGLNFGGDNHSDIELLDEVTETDAAMASMNLLWLRLKAANLQDRVVFASLNTFGRTLIRNSGGGRNHNGQHHSLVTFGPGIKPGVVGGLEPTYSKGAITDFKATDIDSRSGSAAQNGDIPFAETLVASGKTLAKAVGIDDSIINTRFDGGKIITGALL